LNPAGWPCNEAAYEVFVLATEPPLIESPRGEESVEGPLEKEE
jgi:hypothetical protein